MKKIFTLGILLLTVTISAYSQNDNWSSKVINNSVEIVKPVDYITDEEGKEHVVDKSKTFLHIQIISFGSTGNIVKYWIEQNSRRYNMHIAEDVIILQGKSDSALGYTIADKNFTYMVYFEHKPVDPNESVRMVDFRVKER